MAQGSDAKGAESRPSTTAASPRDGVPKFWAPFLHGGRPLGVWLGLVGRNWFRINWRCWPAVLVVTLIAALRSLLGAWSRVKFGRAVEQTPLHGAPIFVLGHWRTGTTLLHELLALDERFAYPTLYECFFPLHFLLTETGALRRFNKRPPFRRVQDNMLISLASPGEDEVGLAALGAGSPYEGIAFPNLAAPADDYFDLVNLPPDRRERWKRMFQQYIRELNFRHRRRLVLKSPIHTARVKTLLEVFPEAKFVNIVRDPRVVFASTLHLWRSLTRLFSLQRPDLSNLEERVIHYYRRMHTRLREARPLVPRGNYCEVRYEQLVRDPVGQMQAVYAALDLGGFDTVKPRIEAYFASRKDYRTNRYQLTPDQLAKVGAGLAEVIAETGYAAPQSLPQSE